MSNAPDPDSFIREHGPEAMQDAIDAATPMRAALLQAVVRGEYVDPKSLARRVTEVDLIEAAAGILAIVSQLRNGECAEVESESVDLQRSAIVLAMTGRVAPAKLARIPDAAFVGAPRLFAWACALHALRVVGRNLPRANVNGRGVWISSEPGRPLDVVRLMLASAPAPDLPVGMPSITKADLADYRVRFGVEATYDFLMDLCTTGRDTPGTMAWLWAETYAELDAIEARTYDVTPDVIAHLLADLRAREARSWIEPVVAGIARGKPPIDTAARLRTAAEIFEGRRTNDEGDRR